MNVRERNPWIKKEFQAFQFIFIYIFSRLMFVVKCLRNLSRTTRNGILLIAMVRLKLTKKGWKGK